MDLQNRQKRFVEGTLRHRFSRQQIHLAGDARVKDEVLPRRFAHRLDDDANIRVFPVQRDTGILRQTT